MLVRYYKMSEIIRLERVRDYCHRYHMECPNELVAIIDYSSVENMRLELMSMGFYAIILKESYEGQITYGLSKYTYNNGSLLFVGPNQIFGIDGGIEPAPLGYALLFHQNLFRGMPDAAKKVSEFKFFTYENNEALSINDSEREVILDCMTNVITELKNPQDQHSNKIIACHIMALLCNVERFEDRMIAASKEIKHELYMKFNQILDDYYASELPETKGLPSVQYCAKKLSLSPNYFGDIIKRISGTSAKEHIQQVTINQVKKLLMDRSLSISEVAYKSGFKYPHHLSRVFKKMTGLSPFEYRRKMLRGDFY